jgi:hypothetical protein
VLISAQRLKKNICTKIEEIGETCKNTKEFTRAKT